jgi:uncharacterized protein YbgA (DUF1722 family)
MEDKNNIKKIIESKEYVVELVKGYSGKSPVYAVVLLIKSELASFRNSLATRDTNLSNYGVVLTTGESHCPPLDIIEQIESKINKSPTN